MKLDERLGLLEKEIGAAGDAVTKLRLDMQTQLDELTLTVETLKRYLSGHHADFDQHYQKIRQQVVKEVDPETTRE